MEEYMIVYSDGRTEIVQQDSIASVVYMVDGIEWDYVIAVFKL